MSEFFDVHEQGELYEADGSAPTTMVRVNSSNFAVEPGSNFVATVTSFAEKASFGKFKVYLNGAEISGALSAPEFIAEGSKIEIRPYDVAG